MGHVRAIDEAGKDDEDENGKEDNGCDDFNDYQEENVNDQGMGVRRGTGRWGTTPWVRKKGGGSSATGAARHQCSPLAGRQAGGQAGVCRQAGPVDAARRRRGNGDAAGGGVWGLRPRSPPGARESHAETTGACGRAGTDRPKPRYVVSWGRGGPGPGETVEEISRRTGGAPPVEGFGFPWGGWALRPGWFPAPEVTGWTGIQEKGPS